MNFANRTIWTADNMEILPGIDSESTDHVWPRIKGGPDTLENPQLLCRHCNSLKSTGTMDDLAVKLSAWQKRGR